MHELRRAYQQHPLSAPLLARVVSVFFVVVYGRCSLAASLSSAAGDRYSKIPHIVQIPSGQFLQGYTNTPIPPELSKAAKLFPNGDFDEQPYHTAYIHRSFYASAFEITNLQYEQFRPEHAKYRNVLNFSKHDDDAVLFVSWHDAVDYCSWLTETYGKQHGMRYRLLTESEWEWSARANTKTLFWTGDTVPKEMLNHNDCNNGMPRPGDVTVTRVGRFQPNPFGLYDTLGNVEEWVDDWYHLYEEYGDKRSSDPQQQDFKVTRGGSHGTEVYYLRSANRQAAVPTEKNWFIGFRIAADNVTDSHISSQILPGSSDRKHRGLSTLHPPSVASKPTTAKRQKQPSGPLTKMGSASLPLLKPYVNIPMPAGQSRLPFIVHNHDPTVAACKMYDKEANKVVDKGLIASWFSTNCGEAGRCAGIAYSRLPPNANEWTEAKTDLNIADRTQCCPAYFYDQDTYRLYQFSAGK
jgi:formylglycine-generating enzyme